jgi:hypothetical protein
MDVGTLLGCTDGIFDGVLLGWLLNVGTLDGMFDGNALGCMDGKQACRPGVVSALILAAVVVVVHGVPFPKIHWLASNVLVGPLPGLR